MGHAIEVIIGKVFWLADSSTKNERYLELKIGCML